MYFRKEYYFLSNFYPCIVDFAGERHMSAEHAYQAAKCVSPADREYIRTCSSPSAAKRAARSCEIRSDWPETKIRFMRAILQAKFSNPTLAAQLLALPGEIVEENWWGDTFWGKYNGKGRNELGKLLMEIRNELQV